MAHELAARTGGRGRRLRVASVWLALASAAVAWPAVGQTSPPAASPEGNIQTDPVIAQARSAFDEGIRLAKEERWVPALEALERSSALHPHAVTTYNAGYCERLLGHPTRARKLLARALDGTRGEGVLPDELARDAREYLADAERQIATVVVTITPGAVAVDGRPLELADAKAARPVLLAGTRDEGPAETPPAATFEVQVDPGTHVFVLSASGRPDVVANRTLAPGTNPALELRAPPVPQASANPKPVAAAQVETSTPRPASRRPAFIAFGIGAAGLAVGAVSGIIAFTYKNPVNKCAGMDTDYCNSKRASANNAADTSTVSFIIGGAAVAVGAVLLYFESTGHGPNSSPGTAPNDILVRPSVGLGTLGLEGHF
jgi:hypothetical protein